MPDLITPVIVGIFGVVAVLVILGFVLIRQSTGKPRFESQDYYKSYKRNDARGGNPFKPVPNTANQGDNRAVATAVIAIVVVAVITAVFLGFFEALLVIFLLPIVVRFIRMRREANGNRNKARDENRSPY